MFFEHLKQFTKPFRHRLVKFLTPQLYKSFETDFPLVDVIPRPFTRFLKKKYSCFPSICGCEVGFGSGYNAENLLWELNLRNLVCIDNFIGKRYFYKGVAITRYIDMDKSLYSILVNDRRVKFIHKDSRVALEELQGSNFDFVYIDGGHDYETVYHDLRLAYGCVKPFGYVGGHDFVKTCFDVVLAVCDFAKELNQVPVVVQPDFWFRVK